MSQTLLEWRYKSSNLLLLFIIIIAIIIVIIIGDESWNVKVDCNRFLDNWW